MASRGGGAPFPLVVAVGRVHKSGAVVRFEGVEDRDQAEELRGLDLEVSRSEVPPAPEGTYYQYELLGCLCRNDGEEIGRVVEVLEDQPDEVDVQEIPNRQGGGVLELTVAPDDLGKVIGRQGRTARAMRTLLETREDRRGVRHELEILED